MKPFALPDNETRLIIHDGTVYKIKLVYVSKSREREESGLPCDPRTMQMELQDAIRVILLGAPTPVKTDHFVISAARSPWKVASLMVFIRGERRLKAHSTMLTIVVQPRRDFLGQTGTGQSQQTASGPVLLLRRTRKQSWNVRLDEKSSSPSSPKKPRSFEKRRTFKGRSSRVQGTRQTQGTRQVQDTRLQKDLPRHIVSRAPVTPSKEQPLKQYHLRSRDLEAQGTRQRQKEQSEEVSLGSKQAAQTSQDRQDSARASFPVCQAEPRVGVTAAADLPPAYPRGGAVHQGTLAGQPGRFDEEQHQLDEQMRLQRLAGTQPEAGVRPLHGHHQLRPRGSLQHVVSAVLTPLRRLFHQSQ